MYGDHNTPEARKYRATRSLETAAGRLYDKVSHRGFLTTLRQLFGKQDGIKLFTLEAVRRQVCIEGERYLGEMNVDLDHVLGTVEEGRGRDFDIDFRPLKEHNKERWLGVAAAWISGRRLGRVNLVQVGDIFFVVDGHHRISVAKAMGERVIEAEVVQLLGTGTLTLPAGENSPSYGLQGSLQPVPA